jgi:ubiquinone biosynthesis protein Coq4
MIEPSNQAQEASILESFLDLVKSPYGDLSAINRLSKALNDPATLQRLVAFLSLTSQGKQAFSEYPLLGPINLQCLHQLPSHTLGHVYADHMIYHGLSPRPVSEPIDDPLVYIGVHIGETHDLWHVVTGCDIDHVGEVQLEAFYTAQLHHDRLFLTLLAKNLLKTAMYEIDLREKIMDGLMQGWMLGRRAKPLFGIRWNNLWEQPLQAVRESLNLITPPP